MVQICGIAMKNWWSKCRVENIQTESRQLYDFIHSTPGISHSLYQLESNFIEHVDMWKIPPTYLHVLALSVTDKRALRTRTEAQNWGGCLELELRYSIC